MNRTIRSLLLVGLTVLSGLTAVQGTESEFPVLKGPYLGQKPPGMIPELFAPGIITTGERNELNSVFSPGGEEFYYAIYTPGPVNTCVIMVSRQIGGIWSRPEAASFSGSGIDVDMAFAPDGNRLYFCSVRGESKHDIWFVDRQKNGGWSEPIRLGPVINSRGGETYPTFTRNGRMYFSAAYPGGAGGKDIYYSDPVDGKFTKPVNAGPTVNTRHSEGDTFVDPGEGFLIVSARGRPDSLGEGDLYVSFKQKDGTWTRPENMGEPVNSNATEYCPMVTPDGRYLFFSRYSDGKSDIYWVSAEVLGEHHH